MRGNSAQQQGAVVGESGESHQLFQEMSKGSRVSVSISSPSWITPSHEHIPCTQGKYAEAEPLYERSQAIREKVLGPEHPDVAQSLNNRAGLLRSQVRAARSFEVL